MVKILREAEASEESKVITAEDVKAFDKTDFSALEKLIGERLFLPSFKLNIDLKKLVGKSIYGTTLLPPQDFVTEIGPARRFLKKVTCKVWASIERAKGTLYLNVAASATPIDRKRQRVTLSRGEEDVFIGRVSPTGEWEEFR